MQERTGLSETTETFLVNKDNMLITDTVYAPDGAFKKWIFDEGVKRAKAGEQDVDVFIDYRGETVIGSYRWLAGFDIVLIAKQDQSEALASIKSIQNTIIIMFSIIIIFAVLLYLALYRSIGKPIKHLVEATQRVAQGNLNHRVDITGDDEISALTKSFNRMTENLNIITASRDELNKEISERKQVEKTLIESEERFRRVFEDSRNGMMLVDQQGRYIKVNKAMTEILGYSEPELLSMGSKDITYQGDITSDSKIVQQLWTGESDGFSAEKRYVHEDGCVIWGAITVSPIHDSDGKTRYVLVQVENITERKQAEQIKDEFIGMVSHELKTPLTIMMGALNVLTNQELSEEQARELMQDASSSVDTMVGIVENLLELARSQSDRMILHLEPIDVVKIAREVARELQRKSAAHRLIVTPASEKAIALADPVKVERILCNLIENAIKYSPNGGDVRISAQRQDNQVIVEVSDQGIGISRQDQSRLFQSFERINAYKTNSIAGIGLGLRVCRLLVEVLGGRIWVESKPGKGSTFFFSLPAADDDNQVRS